MLNSELKAAWVAALRSGEYKQGRGALCRDDHYCCLGVLADVAAFKREDDTATGFSLFSLDNRSHAHVGSLSQSMLDSIGMSPEQQGELIDMNDMRNNSFYEIADYIEKNL